MRTQNILDFDDEASVQTYNFTMIAVKKFYDIIDSDRFRDASGETIYQYLTKMMEQVSFKEHLKRYLHESIAKHATSSDMDDATWMLTAFEKNACMEGKTRQELKRQINRWLKAETVKRENMFLIGFGLDMDDKTVTKFLTLVLKEADFDFYNPEEVIFWHCLHNGKSLQTARKMLTTYDQMEEKTPVRIDHRWQAMQNMPKMYLGIEDELWTYLYYLKFLNIARQKMSKSRSVFEKLYAATQTAVAEAMNRYPDERAKKVMAKDINPGKIESVLYSGVPVTEKGNLQSFAELKKQFKSKRLNRVRMNDLLSGKQMERFDLITLKFLIDALDEEKIRMHAGARFSDFVETTNDLLVEAGMLELYPVNPYEAFILMCMVSDDPLDTFASVWERSYEEETLDDSLEANYLMP